MRLTKIVFVVFAALFIIFQGCKELYEPEIFVDKNYLVVDGLITDKLGPHRIQLSRTNVFGSGSYSSPVSNATIIIEDSQNNRTRLAERGHGIYFTPEDFAGQIGETYVLHIRTADGPVYMSKPQTIIAPVDINSLYAKYATENFFYESHVSEGIIQREVAGMNLFIDVSRNDNQYPKYRFGSTLMLQFEVMVPDPDGGAPGYNMCWTKREITDYLYSDIVKTLSYPESKQNRIAFIPLDSYSMRYLGFPPDKNDITISYNQARIILKSVYTLNDEAYKFHYERNRQLSNEGSFFDPVSPQLTSNVFNTKDPYEIVLGFFEASAISKATFNIKPMGEFIEIDTLRCLEHIPSSGCVFMRFPDWWI